MGTLFSGIFDSELVSVISFSDFMLCMMCALVVGLILAGMYMYRIDIQKVLWQPLHCCRLLCVQSL